MVGVKSVAPPKTDLPVLLSTVLSSAVVVLVCCVVIVTPQDSGTQDSGLDLNDEGLSLNDTPCSQGNPQLGSVAGGTAVGGLLLALLAFLLGMLAGAASHQRWTASHAHKGEESEHTYLPMSSPAPQQGTWGDLGGRVSERYGQEEGVSSHPINIPLNSAHHVQVGGGAVATGDQSHQGLDDGGNVPTSAEVEGQLYDTIPERTGAAHSTGHAHLPTAIKEDYENINTKQTVPQMRPQIHAHSCDNLLFESAFSAPAHITRSVEGLGLLGGGRGQEEEWGRGQEESGRGQGEEQLYEDVKDIRGGGGHLGGGPLAGGYEDVGGGGHLAGGPLAGGYEDVGGGGPLAGGGKTEYEDCHAPSFSKIRLQGIKYDYVTTGGRGWRQSQDALNRIATKQDERLVCSTEVSMERKSADVGRKSRVPKVGSKPRPLQADSTPRIAIKPQKLCTKPRPQRIGNHDYTDDDDDDESYVVSIETRKNRTSGSPLTPMGETTPLSPRDGTQRDTPPKQKTLTLRGGKALPLTPGERKSLPLPPRKITLTPREDDP